MKEIKKKLMFVCVVGLFVVAVTAVPASALISLGNDPSAPAAAPSDFALMDSVPGFGGGSGGAGWWIGEGTPVEIEFVAGWWWWPKLLWGYQIGDGLPTLDEGAQLGIRESLKVSDMEDEWCWWWWDWEERWWGYELNPGWEWGNNPVVWVDDGSGSAPWDYSLVLDPSGEIGFEFVNPLLPGYLIDIWKPIIWVGPGQWLPGYGPLWIYEYPTPEPATLAVLGLGLGGLALVRRRRKS